MRGGTKQNIGETVRSNGEAETTIEQRCLTPPLCFATQNIGEVSRSDGGVEKTRLCLFILLSSEKNELRSSGSYRAIRLVATVAVGVCGTRSARTVLALFPPSPLRLHRPIKADRGLCICLYSNPPRPAGTPPYRFAPPRHAAGHGRVRRG